MRGQGISEERLRIDQGLWSEHLLRSSGACERLEPPPVEGYLTRMVGLTLEASGCQAAIGDCCDVLASDGARIEAEVVGFAGDHLYLMPTGDSHGLKPNARVIPRPVAGMCALVRKCSGRVIDGAGAATRRARALECEDRMRLTGVPHQSTARDSRSIEPLDVGVRAINSLLTVGRGQRIGLFAGSGVGKSVLLGHDGPLHECRRHRRRADRRARPRSEGIHRKHSRAAEGRGARGGRGGPGRQPAADAPARRAGWRRRLPSISATRARTCC